MKNWKTTIGGILAAIGAAGIGIESVPADYKWIFAVLAAAGTVLMGTAAKDFNVHSTTTEVQKSTEQAREFGKDL